MNRCCKLYSAVEHLNTVFKLMKKAKTGKDADAAVVPLNLNERVLCAIKGFLTDHTLFPVQFIFNQSDLLETLC